MAQPSPEDLGFVGRPIPSDLARFLAWPPFDLEQEAQAEAHLIRAERLVRTYTRRRGFIGPSMAPELAEVILSTAARTMNNPTSDSRVQAGQFSSLPGQPDFTLQERLTLNTWRRRAA